MTDLEMLILMLTAFTAACALVTTLAQLLLTIRKGRDD